MKRTFILGDEWLYYKLYCGKKIADSILVDVIKPVTEKLLSKDLIDQWFFIRYSDPEFHLRIRFHFNETFKLPIIIYEIKKAIDYYIDNNLIWKVQIDTYQREIERYGIKTMLISENIFYIDSIVCVKALHLVEDDNLLFMFSLRSINDILDFFELNIKEKLIFVKENLDAFKAEFNSNKNLTKQLNKKHQELKVEVIEFIDIKQHVEYDALIDLLNFKNKRFATLLKKKTLNKANVINSLLPSYIHMMVNRLFRDKQRLHELVCYDSLYRFYNFKLATNSINK